jgi:hypothetical protein
MLSLISGDRREKPCVTVHFCPGSDGNPPCDHVARIALDGGGTHGESVARMKGSEIRDSSGVMPVPRIALSLSSGGALRRPVGSMRATRLESGARVIAARLPLAAGRCMGRAHRRSRACAPGP